ncbi:NAD-dependent epimerase/dehydratase family protein [Lysobacter sp. D1-1-M9]|uniref:NAD-dependent epimerase/dehydratase family protein n=1 Tax=Novilysobacter longmucuonensis TaxID=3098603 RepID=UPI002FC7D7AC
MREALIFGGSGQIGRPLLHRLRGEGWHITALSRGTPPDEPGVQWLRGDLQTPPALPARVDAIFSCGPLDAFARWYADSGIDSARVIAFGSTSLDTKRASSDRHEREVAARLHQGESTVFATASARGAAATLLRPTLVYGAGRDATLSRIAAIARRFGCFPLPRGACGLRQPVHVEDLADAALRAIDAPASAGQAYALPGGETLPYREMVVRVLSALQPPARLLELPAPLFRLALQAARLGGRAPGFGSAALRRMHQDLVFDAMPAVRDLDYAPRAFAPTAEMFVASEA